MPQKFATITYAELSNILSSMTHHVQAGDSFEGYIEYAMTDIDHKCQETPCGHVMVRAGFRVNNKYGGQDGMRFVGDFNEGNSEKT
jgi:hypothetical protein